MHVLVSSPVSSITSKLIPRKKIARNYYHRQQRSPLSGANICSVSGLTIINLLLLGL